MALFIEVQVAPELANDEANAKQLEEVCPVDVFSSKSGGGLEIVDANVDECTLCELCLAVGKPGQVKIVKLYEDGGGALERTA